MAVLSDASQNASLTMNQKIQLNISFWDWFEKNPEEPIFTVRVLGVSVFTVRVKHLVALWHLLFGARMG